MMRHNVLVSDNYFPVQIIRYGSGGRSEGFVLVVEYVFGGFLCTFINLERKATKAGKSALTTIKKTVGIPTGHISEANPRYYMVLARQGALVRKELDLDSPEVFKLEFGDVVTCVDISGRRARIIDPVEGWVSISSQQDEVILEPTFPPSKSSQVRTMNRRFDKLKIQQATVRSVSPVAAPEINRISASEKPLSPVGSPKQSLETLKSKIVFKHSTGPKKDEPVPVLGNLKPLPGLITAPEVDLLDLGTSSESQGQQYQQSPKDISTSLI